MKLFATSLVALTAMTLPAFAACKEYVTVTPDTAPNVRSVVIGQTSGGPDHNGTAYTKATFCPVKAAAGTCTGESLSTFVAGPVYGPKTFLDGDVPDITQHRNGLQIGPVFVPLTGYLPGAC